MTTYERIQSAAKKRGMNLREVAKSAGLKSETAIYRYNQGVTPRESTLRSIADVLNVSVDYLLGNTDDMHVNKKATSNNPVDLKEVAENDNWDDYLSADGRPLSDHDKKLLRAIFGD